MVAKSWDEALEQFDVPHTTAIRVMTVPGGPIAYIPVYACADHAAAVYGDAAPIIEIQGTAPPVEVECSACGGTEKELPACRKDACDIINRHDGPCPECPECCDAEA